MSNEAAAACLLGGVILLIALAVIDLRTWLLPNRGVAALAVLGILFHCATGWRFLTPLQMVSGGALGFGVLFAMRVIANRAYGEDALGLGDVKLLGAAGLWLGGHLVMLAMAAGAGAALLHGLIVSLLMARHDKRWPDFRRLKIPAGPGFAAGILGVAVMRYWGFWS